MPILANLKELQKRHALVTTQLLRLEGNPDFKADMRFLEDLNLLMTEYGKSKVEVADIARRLMADETASLGALHGKAPTRHRKLKTYINPFTKECVHTRGNYSRLLRSWIDRYGTAVVETWAEP